MSTEPAPVKPPWIDVVVGLAAVAFAIVNFYVASLATEAADMRPADAGGYILIVVVVIPVIWRRSHPVAVVVISTVAWTVARLFNYPVGVEFLALAIGMHALGSYVQRDRSPKIAIPITAFHMGFTVLGVAFADVDWVILGPLLLTLILPYMLGREGYERRSRAEAAEVRAAELERNQAVMEQSAISRERTRIARELHDVVAHEMTVMTIQAAAAKRVVHNDPDRAIEAMSAIEEAGHAALIEMRRMLGVLRTDAASEAAPQPGLALLPELAESMEEAGLPVAIKQHGTPQKLSPGLDLNAYRIIQESLTNSLRHGGTRTHAAVDVEFVSHALKISVSDDGRGPTPGGDETGNGGHGLIGMRERVALLNGTFSAGPRAGGGFVVTAQLPIEAS